MARSILLPSIATTVIALLITYWIKAKYIYIDGACPPVRLYRRTHNAHEESSNDSSKIHGMKPSGHAAEAHCDGNGSSYRYEDCNCDDSGDVMNCDNDIYTFHHIHHMEIPVRRLSSHPLLWNHRKLSTWHYTSDHDCWTISSILSIWIKYIGASMTCSASATAIQCWWLT